MSNSLMAIDIGSNGIRMSIVRKTSKGSYRRHCKERYSVRLGKSVFTTGKIGDEEMASTLCAFRRMRRAMDQHGIQHYRAVATSACREAANAKVLLRRIERKTGIRVEVISGIQEAHLIRSAVTELMDVLTPTLIVDLGGGSLEINEQQGDRLLRSHTLPLGTLRLMERFGCAGAIGSKKEKRLRRFIDRALEEALPSGLIEGGATVVACGGNPEELARIAPAKGPQLYDLLDLRRLDRVLPDLLERDVVSRQKKYDIGRSRAEVISIAAIVLSRLGRHVRSRSFAIPGVGLREGLLLSLQKRVEQKTRRNAGDQRRIPAVS